MTWKIEKNSDGQKTILRLIGQIQSEHLEELKAQITGVGPRMVLDLDEVTLVDVDVIRFLSVCEDEGLEVVHCSPYIREWMRREPDRRK